MKSITALPILILLFAFFAVLKKPGTNSFTNEKSLLLSRNSERKTGKTFAELRVQRNKQKKAQRKQW